MKFLVIVFFVINIYGDNYEYHTKHHINKELSHLNLTSNQQKDIKKILKSFRKSLVKHRELKYNIDKKRKQLFLKDILDIKKLNDLNKIVDKNSYKIENKLLQEIHTILNKKQREMFIYYFDDWEVD